MKLSWPKASPTMYTDFNSDAQNDAQTARYDITVSG